MAYGATLEARAEMEKELRGLHSAFSLCPMMSLRAAELVAGASRGEQPVRVLSSACRAKIGNARLHAQSAEKQWRSPVVLAPPGACHARSAPAMDAPAAAAAKAAAAAAAAAATPANKPVVLVVIGMAGSGKTTFMQARGFH